MMRKNKLKERLREGKATIGTHMLSTWPSIVEIIGHAGVIDYVEPVINAKTRTSLARVVMENASGGLRPGTFITADVLVTKRKADQEIKNDYKAISMSEL